VAGGQEDSPVPSNHHGKGQGKGGAGRSGWPLRNTGLPSLPHIINKGRLQHPLIKPSLLLLGTYLL
jgi:hypothetical protein